MKRPLIFPENYDPPKGVRTFYVRVVYGMDTRRERSIYSLTDDEFAWVERVVQAERERRKERQAVAS